MSELKYLGGNTLGETLPGLAKTANDLDKALDELTTTHDEYGRKVNAWEAQKKELDDKLEQADGLIRTLQGKLGDLDELLDTARDFASGVLQSVELTGFHRHSYGGSLGDFPAAITHYQTGLKATTGWSDEGQTYAVLVVAGVGMDIPGSAEKIAAMAQNFATEGWDGWQS